MSSPTFFMPSLLFSRCLAILSLCFRFCSKISFHTFLVLSFLFPRYLSILSLCLCFCFQDILPYFPYVFVSVSKISFHTFLVLSLLFSRCLRLCFPYAFVSVFMMSSSITILFLCRFFSLTLCCGRLSVPAL